MNNDGCVVPFLGLLMKSHIPKNTIFLFHSAPPPLYFFLFLRLSSLIIHLFLSDAKTTTNRTTAQIIYSVKSSLSEGWGWGKEGGREGGEGTAKMCTGVRQESTPTGRGSMSLGSVAGRKKNKCQRGEKFKNK